MSEDVEKLLAARAARMADHDGVGVALVHIFGAANDVMTDLLTARDSLIGQPGRLADMLSDMADADMAADADPADIDPVADARKAADDAIAVALAAAERADALTAEADRLKAEKDAADAAEADRIAAEKAAADAAEAERIAAEKAAKIKGRR